VKRVVVLPLHGTSFECASLAAAIGFVEDYDKKAANAPAVRYEVELSYDNDDRIDGSFADKESALEFLRTFERPAMKPSTEATTRPRRPARR